MIKRTVRRKQRQSHDVRSRNLVVTKLPERSQAARDRALHALAAIRNGISISRAARENGVSPRTIERYAGSELVQDRRGKPIRATKSDNLVRYLLIPGPNGPIEISVHGSKAASKVANYKAAVNRFLRGDRNALADWHGKRIAGVELITDGDVLVDQADKGLLPYALYRSLSGGAV